MQVEQPHARVMFRNVRGTPRRNRRRDDPLTLRKTKAAELLPVNQVLLTLGLVTFSHRGGLAGKAEILRSSSHRRAKVRTELPTSSSATHESKHRQPREQP